MGEELKRCPICNGHDLHIFNCDIDMDLLGNLVHSWRVYCKTCANSKYASPELAAEAWNKRA